MNILITVPKGDVRDTFFPEAAIQQLSSVGTLFWNDTGSDLTQASLGRMLPGMDACITGWGSPFFGPEVLALADRLRIVAHTGGSVAPLVGPDFFDRGLTIVSGNWLYAESVAEGVIGYLLCALRRLPYFSNEVQQGRWRSEKFRNEGLLDKTIGLVGFGLVAKYLVPMLKPFHVRVKVYDPYVSDSLLQSFGVSRATLPEIFEQCDIVSVHAPRAPETTGMISKALLRSLRDGALFINTARGSLVDEEALATELVTGRFSAVLDVFDTEPLPADSRLRGLDNALLIPHMGGPTMDRRIVVTMAMAEEMQRFFSGDPLRYHIGREYALSMTR